MQRLVRACFSGASGYSFAKKAADVAREHGIERVARLASNENPRPPSQAVIEAGRAALLEANRYPDERASVFVEALRRYHGDYRFVTGAGMDGVIETLIRTVVEPGETVVISTPTFSFYGIAAIAHGARVVNAPRRKEDFSVDPADFIRACGGAKLAFLCTPNNPTGNTVALETVEEILEGLEGLLFLDNAYIEFSDMDYLPLMHRHENLVIGRTMSKIFALAGLRVGYAFVPGWLEPFYNRAATPFALNSVSAAAAAAALAEEESVRETREHVLRWRRRFIEEIPGAYPSDANFVMIDVAPYTGDEVVERLAARGVLVRSCTTFPGLGDHYIRVSIGDDRENALFMEAIRDL